MAMLSNQMVYTYEISLEIFHGASPVIFQANRWGDFGGCLTKPSFSGYLSDRPHEINTGSLGTHTYIYILWRCINFFFIIPEYTTFFGNEQ